jgi:hypothetical protein
MVSDFDIEKLRLPPNLALPPKPAAAAKSQQQQREFVQISRGQLTVLRRGKATLAAWNVLIELIWLTWKKSGKPSGVSIRLTNKGQLCISPDSKTRAIGELAKLGLVRIDRAAPRQSPMATVLEV